MNKKNTSVSTHDDITVEQDYQEFLYKPTKKKHKTELLATIFFINNNVKKSSRVQNCATYLEFKHFTDNTTKLHTANFCKLRLCPMCSWRLALKRIANLSAVTTIAKSQKYELLFLTLTTRNVVASELKAEIKRQSEAWRNLVRYSKEYQKSVHGYFRCLEITYNKKTDTYHPHLHIILAVKSHYFKVSEYYINQQRWQELWQHYLKIDYCAIVDIRKAYSKKSSSAEVEASKYIVKDSDYLIKDDLKLSAKIVKVLDEALTRCRLISYGGILKEIYEKLKLDDDEMLEDNEIINSDLDYIIKAYFYNFASQLYQLTYREVKD
jgi:plasmid rolling circle replication initiator protein Rep